MIEPAIWRERGRSGTQRYGGFDTTTTEADGWSRLAFRSLSASAAVGAPLAGNRPGVVLAVPRRSARHRCVATVACHCVRAWHAGRLFAGAVALPREEGD